MAVKCRKRIVPRFYFPGSHKERKSVYFLRNSSFNLSCNSSPKCLSSSLNIINKHSTQKKNKDLDSMQDKKREYNLRNSSFNLSYNSLPKRTTRSLESAPEPPRRNKFGSTVGRKKENSLRNSCSTVSHNSRPKRNASCIEFSPNKRTDHPMRKKLRKLAYLSTPKNTSVIDQNLAKDKDLNSSVLMRKQRKVLNSISIKFLDSENALQSLKTSPRRISTRSISKTLEMSEKSNKTSEKVMKAANSSVSEGFGGARKGKKMLRSQSDKVCNSEQPELKDSIVRVIPLCEDDLVHKPKYKKNAKGEAKTLKVKRSLETPVIKQNLSRSLRSKGNCGNVCAEKNVLGYSPKASICNQTSDNIYEQKVSLKVNYLDTVTPVTTRLNKRSCKMKYPSEEVVMAPVPIRGRKKKNSIKISTDARQFPCINDLEGNKNSVKTCSQKEIRNGNTDGKEQVKSQRKTRNTRVSYFESPNEKKITRSTTFGNKCVELSPLGSFPKKSKRHTLPHSNKSSKSKNHSRVNSVGHFNNVPLDVLIRPATSFHESQAHTCKTDLVSAKIVAPKPSLKAKKKDPMKSSVMEISLKGKKKISSKASLKAKNDVPMKSPVPKISLKGKKTEVELPEKTSGPNKKVPAVGTLKRKRWIMKTLTEKSEGHEDDIFENRKIEFPNPFVGSTISDDESDATDFSIATPICGFLLTPNTSRRSPQYKPCISSNDLTAARKVAEEYLYRRNKTWKQACKNFPENKTVTSEKKQRLENKTEYSEALADVLKAQAVVEKLTQEESEEEDEYFSDVF